MVKLAINFWEEFFREKRNIGLYIVLSIVTCGIFHLVWIAMMANDLRILASEEEKMSGGLVVLLSIVTCGIFLYVWYYQAGESINRAKALRNMPVDNSMGIAYLLLGIFGLGIVSNALIQSEINSMLDGGAPTYPNNGGNNGYGYGAGNPSTRTYNTNNYYGQNNQNGQNYYGGQQYGGSQQQYGQQQNGNVPPQANPYSDGPSINGQNSYNSGFSASDLDKQDGNDQNNQN